MAKTVAPDKDQEQDAPAKPKSVFARTGTDGDGLKWGELDINETTYRLRQVLVEEQDTAWDAAYDEKTDTVNWRLYNRLNLVSGIVSPPTTSDDIAKWPGVKLTLLLRAHGELNTLKDADTEGN